MGEGSFTENISKNKDLLEILKKLNKWFSFFTKGGGGGGCQLNMEIPTFLNVTIKWKQ
jgi:hypothetical protein